MKNIEKKNVEKMKRMAKRRMRCDDASCLVLFINYIEGLVGIGELFFPLNSLTHRQTREEREEKNKIFFL
jgi:hypothetical protein